MSDETPRFVAQCARAIASKEQCWYRPAAILSKGLVSITKGRCAVWITCGSEGAITCYRLLYSRMDQPPSHPMLCREDTQKQDSDGQWSVSFWSVPGNVRDLAETIARIWLGVPV